MNFIRNFIRPCLVSFSLFFILCAFVYPLSVGILDIIFFPDKASGSIIYQDQIAIGSKLIGQNFQDPQYFWGRPSATLPTPYNPLASKSSNAKVTSKAYLQELSLRKKSWINSNPEPILTSVVPIDLLTASASGLDPEISLEAAIYQIPRVATQRSIKYSVLRKLINSQAEYSIHSLLGQPRVNVLLLNLALDKIQSNSQKNLE